MKTGKIIDFQLTLPMYAQPAQYSTYKNPKWLNNPTIRKYWPAMQTMESFLTANTVNVDAVQLQGPELTVNQGLLLNSEVITTMYQNVLTRRMSPDDAIDDCAKKIRLFTHPLG